MRSILLSAAAALFASQPLAAQSQASPPPRLLVVIAVDQFSADLFDEYRAQFTGGFARLSSGTLFRNGYQSHASTETCPGHSTMLTGDHPARTGIVANNWTDRTAARADKNVYCAEDESAPGSSSSNYVVSAKHLLVPTLGELMKARWPSSRTVAVSGKDRAAVMMGGHSPDQRWYWTGGRFDSDLAGATVPTVVAKVNAAASAGLAQARQPLEPTPFCAAKAAPVALPGGQVVGNGRLARAAGDQAGFKASTELDGDTLALAAGLVDEMQLGRRAAPDMLAISLSATDYVGHSYGTEGQEMCLHLTELDRELGDFLAVLDARGIDYAVALTADHGGKDIPERERLQGVATASRVSGSLGAMAKAADLIGGPAGDVYVDPKVPARARAKTVAAALSAYRHDPQVEAAFSGAEIAATPVATSTPDRWNLIERVRASYYPGRSGDLYVILKKDVSPIASPHPGSVATHGSPWDYDRRVPILFWRPGMSPATVERPADTVDIMPTLAAEIGLGLPSGSVDGRCLPEAAACPAGLAPQLTLPN